MSQTDQTGDIPLQTGFEPDEGPNEILQDHIDEIQTVLCNSDVPDVSVLTRADLTSVEADTVGRRVTDWFVAQGWAVQSDGHWTRVTSTNIAHTLRFRGWVKAALIILLGTPVLICAEMYPVVRYSDIDLRTLLSLLTSWPVSVLAVLSNVGAMCLIAYDGLAPDLRRWHLPKGGNR